MSNSVLVLGSRYDVKLLDIYFKNLFCKWAAELVNVYKNLKKFIIHLYLEYMNL